MRTLGAREHKRRPSKSESHFQVLRHWEVNIDEDVSAHQHA